MLTGRTIGGPSLELLPGAQLCAVATGRAHEAHGSAASRRRAAPDKVERGAAQRVEAVGHKSHDGGCARAGRRWRGRRVRAGERSDGGGRQGVSGGGSRRADLRQGEASRAKAHVRASATQTLLSGWLAVSRSSTKSHRVCL